MASETEKPLSHQAKLEQNRLVSGGVSQRGTRGLAEPPALPTDPATRTTYRVEAANIW